MLWKNSLPLKEEESKIKVNKKFTTHNWKQLTIDPTNNETVIHTRLLDQSSKSLYVQATL